VRRTHYPRSVKKYAVEARRVEILEATCEVVIERGFAGTRIADVAKRLNVSNSLIHYHFDSKDALLASAFEYYARKDLSEMERDIEMGQSATAQLWRLIESYVPEGSDDVEWMLWIDAWGEALRNPLIRSISQQLDEQSIAFVEKVLRRGNERGEFNCEDPRLSATRITGLIDGLAIQFAAHEGVLRRKDLIRTLRSLAAFETGLAPEDIRDGRRPQRPAAATAVDADTNSLGSQPLSANDDLAIRAVLSRLADAQVRRDARTWLDCFTTTATLDIGEGASASGSEALGALFDRRFGAERWTVNSLDIALFAYGTSTNMARGRLTVTERFGRRNGSTGSRMVVIHDDYERSPKGWLIVARRYTHLD
jgi:AcrR family transcriptional regulator